LSTGDDETAGPTILSIVVPRCNGEAWLAALRGPIYCRGLVLRATRPTETMGKVRLDHQPIDDLTSAPSIWANGMGDVHGSGGWSCRKSQDSPI
jgi:hypothetical protein